MVEIPPDRVKVFSSTIGTGTTIALGAALSNLFMTPAEAGMTNGLTYRYYIEQSLNWEENEGVYNSGASTIGRKATPIRSKINGVVGTTQLDLNGTQIVYFPLVKVWLEQLMAISRWIG